MLTLSFANLTTSIFLILTILYFDCFESLYLTHPINPVVDKRISPIIDNPDPFISPVWGNLFWFIVTFFETGVLPSGSGVTWEVVGASKASSSFLE